MLLTMIYVFKGRCLIEIRLDCKATKILVLVRSDPAGPIQPLVKNSYKYVINFIDDYFGLTMLYSLKHKSNTLLATKKYESIKFHQGMTKRLSVLHQTLSTNKNASSSNSRHNLSKEPTLLMLSKLECVKFSGVKPSKFEFKNFLAQFQNCIMHLESMKLSQHY